MTDWKLGQYVRVWRNEGYEYGHIETMGSLLGRLCCQCSYCQKAYGFTPEDKDKVMLVGDDGKEIYTTVKELEAGE